MLRGIKVDISNPDGDLKNMPIVIGKIMYDKETHAMAKQNKNAMKRKDLTNSASWF